MVLPKPSGRIERDARELGWLTLVVGEAAHAATAARPRCAWRSCGLLAGTFGDGTGSAADEALDVASALWALFDCSVAHLLTLLKMAGTLFE